MDHKSLTFAMGRSAEPWSARQQRQLCFISKFTTDLWHIASKENPVADSLSRAIRGAAQLGLDYDKIAGDQVTDRGVQELRMTVTGLRLEAVPLGKIGTTLLCDVSTGQPRPIVPKEWR